MYSSFRVLLPPNAKPLFTSSRLAQTDAPPRCFVSRSSGWTVLGPKVSGSAHAQPFVEGGRAVGVRVVTTQTTHNAATDSSPADTVIVAAGWATRTLLEPHGIDVPIRPLKGQGLRLRAATDTLRHIVRASVHGRDVYLVPRPGGEIVVGATSEDVGPDTTVTAGAVHDLLHDAIEIVPELAEAAVLESLARLRPATSDNLPLVGATAVPGLTVAAGHGRDGILLAPLTARVVVASVLGETPPPHAAAFAAQRFIPVKERV
jgi:glycine oxidase